MRIQGHAAKALLGVGLLAGAMTAAQAAGPYIGGNISQPEYRAGVNGTIMPGGEDIGYKLYGGYQFSPYFALEGGYLDLGKEDNATGNVHGRGGFIDAVGIFPLTPTWSLLGSAGLAQARFKTSTGNDSSPAYKLGVGVQYDVTKQVAVRLQYDRYRFTDVFNDKLGVGEASLGLKYGF
ncbi:MAG TPA: outer membrane beta-barrel protein [Ideonella sp.]|nr:outer membrane beta-barrel protein [Ideonella sp.]